MNSDSPSGSTPARISAASIRHVSFNRHPNGGIDEDEVRHLLAALADDLDAGEADRAQLRDELSRLTAQLAAQRTPSIVTETVHLLSQAQLVADETIAEAERFARDLVETARDRYHEILRRAEQSAPSAVPATATPPPAQSPTAKPFGPLAPGNALGSGPTGPVGDGYLPIAQLQYLRTYAKVAETQMRAVLQALTAEVDKLGRLPEVPDTAAVTDAAAVYKPAWATGFAARLDTQHPADPSDETEPDKTDQDETGQDETGHDGMRQDESDQDHPDQDNTNQHDAGQHQSPAPARPEGSTLRVVPTLDDEPPNRPTRRSIAEISWDPRISRD